MGVHTCTYDLVVSTWILHVNVTMGLITIAYLTQTNNGFSKLAHVRIVFLKDNRESSTKWTARDVEWSRLHNVIFKMNWERPGC